MRMLASELDGHRYYAAGVPWYATLFGRDSIIAALQTLAFDADIAADTLRLLAARLGSRLDDEHDEEPGKVLHELRQDELAAAGAHAICPVLRDGRRDAAVPVPAVRARRIGPGRSSCSTSCFRRWKRH